MDSANFPKFPSRYRIERILGEGAAGIVYLATDLDQDKLIVIKALKNKLCGSKEASQNTEKRFHNEFNALKNCIHPNIIRVFDFSEFNGLYFFTMEFLEGQTLDNLIANPEINISPDKAVHYLFQMAQAILNVHEQGLIHRDLKPANIFITNEDKIKLLDFGIARQEQANFNLTTTNETLGTPYYMSPEQYAHEPLDIRTDVYSFGIMAYELLTKERPYQSSSHFDLFIKHAAAEIPSAKAINSDVPAWLDGMIKTCMEKDKNRRYRSMLDVIVVMHTNSADCPLDETLEGKLANTDTGKALSKHEKNFNVDHEKRFFASFKRFAMIVAMVFAFMFVWLTPVGVWSTALLLDSLFKLRGEMIPPKDVVIVALDDLTYKHLRVSARRPFPRKYWAQAVSKIHSKKPKIAIIDAYFPPDEEDEEGNKALETAIALGPTALTKCEIPNGSLSEVNQNKDNSLQFYNDPRFSQVAFIEIEPFVTIDSGIVMRLGNYSNNLKDELKTVNELIPIRLALERAGITNLARPAYSEFINFYGRPNRITSYSMHEVIFGNFDFKDKVVLVGYKSIAPADAPGMNDTFTTSGRLWGKGSSKYFGVEIHATVAANLIDHNHLKRLPRKGEYLFLAILSANIFLFLLSKKPYHAVGYLVAILALWFTITYWAFLTYNFLLPGVYLMLVCSFFVCAWIWYLYSSAQDADLREAEEITRMKLRRRIF